MDERRARGAVFTPGPIASALALAALDGRRPPATVCDPAAGDGRLLAAVAERAAGPVRLFGADVEPVEPPGGARSRASLVRADTLATGLSAWPDAPPQGFDLVVGNPPFRGQLADATALTSDERARLRGAFGDVASGYADTAATFLVAACTMAAPDGRVAMIMPLSFLSARDAGPARRRVLELATLEGVWVAGRSVFPDADVQVCAVVLDRSGRRRRRVRRWAGPAWTEAPPIEVDSDELLGAPTWAHLVAPLLHDLPDAPLEGSGVLGDVVTATAGFRDQYYGLAPHLIELDGPVTGRTDGCAPVVTSGLVEPGRVAWGVVPTRIAKQVWDRPGVDPTALDPGSALARWVEERRRPKVVVATQTRVVEAAPDPTGEWIPSTPVVAVHATAPDDLWRSLAVLLAPPVSVWALQHFTGAARSPGALKLSARQVLTIPLPGATAHWERAADLLHGSWDARVGGCPPEAVTGAGRHMTLAYGCPPEVDVWWTSRSGILSAP